MIPANCSPRQLGEGCGRSSALSVISKRASAHTQRKKPQVAVVARSVGSLEKPIMTTLAVRIIRITGSGTTAHDLHARHHRSGKGSEESPGTQFSRDEDLYPTVGESGRHSPTTWDKSQANGKNEGVMVHVNRHPSRPN